MLDFSLRERVLGIVVGWLVGGLLTVNYVIVGGIQEIQRIYLDALATAGGELSFALGAAGASIMGVLDALEAEIITIAGGASWAAPIATALVFALVMVATWALLSVTRRALLWLT